MDKRTANIILVCKRQYNSGANSFEECAEKYKRAKAQPDQIQKEREG